MPDTTDYMIYGYAIAFAILAVTIGSIWWRHRSLAEDEKTLDRLETQENDN